MATNTEKIELCKLNLQLQRFNSVCQMQKKDFSVLSILCLLTPDEHWLDSKSQILPIPEHKQAKLTGLLVEQ